MVETIYTNPSEQLNSNKSDAIKDKPLNNILTINGDLVLLDCFVQKEISLEFGLIQKYTPHLGVYIEPSKVKLM